MSHVLNNKSNVVSVNFKILRGICALINLFCIKRVAHVYIFSLSYQHLIRPILRNEDIIRMHGGGGILFPLLLTLMVSQVQGACDESEGKFSFQNGVWLKKVLKIIL